MPLFFIQDNARWGESFNIVRADSIEQARELAGTSPESEILLLDPEGPPGVLWCHDDSPDTE